MKNKRIIIGGLLVVLIAVIVSVIVLLPKKDNGINKYTIVTDYKYATMMNDGGSYTNVYYEVDFKSGEIKKLEDSYVGFEGFKYQGKELYKKTLKGNILKELKKLVEELIKKEDINDPKNYSTYVIKYEDKEKEIYNKDSIKLLRDRLKEIDEYK